jgi:hypothetical protein
MSQANADRRDQARSVDEWRVDVDEPPNPVADPDDSAAEWSHAAVTERRDRVSAELEGWRGELAERIRRLEQRLDSAPD